MFKTGKNIGFDESIGFDKDIDANKDCVGYKKFFITPITVGCALLIAAVLIILILVWMTSFFVDSNISSVQLPATDERLLLSQSENSLTASNESTLAESDFAKLEATKNNLTKNSPTIINDSEFVTNPVFNNPTCPVDLSASNKQINYTKSETLEVWQTSSELACENYAYKVLVSLKKSGAELLQAGYMDLSAESWSCTVKAADGDSINVVLMPNRPFANRDSENLLQITVIRILPPGWLQK